MRNCFTLVVLSLSSLTLAAQISPSKMIKEGDRYFDQNLYRAALKFYKQAGNIQTWNKKTKLKVGIAQFEVNDLQESTKVLQALRDQGKTDPMVFLYLAKNYQHRDNYKEAINFYKQYLRKKKTDETTRTWVKDEIRRCANGIHLKYGQELAYVENIGAAINTLQDEFDPIPSATYQDRIYFSSNREGSIGGKLNTTGQRDNFFGDYRSDIYTLDQENGSWESIAAIQGNINSRENEILFDISPSGQILYYLSGNQIVTDTFDNDASKPSRKGELNNPLSASDQDCDLQVFSDTIMLFASNREGGYGGYDLYISIKRNGSWKRPENLGPTINTFYDDRYPFLANDGRTLFYSSNNLKSIGGMDVFTSHFDDRTAEWDNPTNMGLPINSPNDDFSFKLRNDGLSAFMASDRKASYGGSDIFLVYLKDQAQEHLKLSSPVTFYQAMEIVERKRAEGEPEIAIQNTDEINEVKEYFISDLFYGANDVILTPQNIKKLDLIANMMLIYPKITLETICHDNADGPDAFNLYFSVKKADKIRDFLVKKGVRGERVTVKGAGNKYPLAMPSNGQVESPLVQKLNKRIDLRFHNYETEPVKIIKEQIEVPANLEDTKGKLFNIVTRDLYYQIELLSATQMFQNEIIENESHAIIEYDPQKNRYIYSVGLAQRYANAKEQREKLILAGFKDAKITAYLNGSRLERHQLIENADKYPDLLNFFEK